MPRRPRAPSNPAPGLRRKSTAPLRYTMTVYPLRVARRFSCRGFFKLCERRVLCGEEGGEDLASFPRKSVALRLGEFVDEAVGAKHLQEPSDAGTAATALARIAGAGLEEVGLQGAVTKSEDPVLPLERRRVCFGATAPPSHGANEETAGPRETSGRALNPLVAATLRCGLRLRNAYSPWIRAAHSPHEDRAFFFGPCMQSRREVDRPSPSARSR